MVKIEQKEKAVFKSLTLTLETKEEADLFWHMINCGTGQSLANYFEEQNLERNLANNFKSVIFDGINSIHTPCNDDKENN